MDRNKKLGLFVVVAFILGAFFTVVLTSQFDWTNEVIASSDNNLAIEEPTKTAPTTKPITQQQENLIAQLNGVFVQAAEKVKPSVVTVFSEKVIKIQRRNPLEYFFGDEYFRQFFDQGKPQNEEYVQRGMGSGVIVKTDGIVLTNYHVVKEADDIRVKLTNGEEYEGEVVGTDPKTDLAIVKIKADNLSAATLGNSDIMKVGEWVLAIGSPFSENLRFTVTKGIVSATGRKGLGLADGEGFENFIQTDAPINPGNSGGPLVNLYGEVIGINTAIVTPSGGFAGIGFAIPINMAGKVMNDLITKGKVVRGWLGVKIQSVDKDMARSLNLKANEGAIVVDVTPNSPAEKGGIRSSDIIIEFNGKEVNNSDQLKFLVADVIPGQTIDVLVNRDGKEKTLRVKVGELGGETLTTPVVTEAAEKIGLEVATLTDENSRQLGYKLGSGVLIVKVDPTKNAARKGLREGDLIIEVNRKPVTNVVEFNEVLQNVNPGKAPALFLIQRGRNKQFAAVEIPKE
jgi:serine protease Do